MKTFIFFPLVVGILLSLGKAEATPANHPMPIVAVVTTTRDSGAGSLRDAIERANRNASTRITFLIPATDAGYHATERRWVLTPLSRLPALRKPDTKIECEGPVTISGANAGSDGIGLQIEAPRCLVKGLGWANWAKAAIVIRSNRTQIQDNAFNDSLEGIAAQDTKSRANRFERNQFAGVSTPIVLRGGANDGVAAPTLAIVRDDTAGRVGHRFTIRFQGKPKSKVTLELDFSPDEARTVPSITKTETVYGAETDAQGVAVWEFTRPGYPAGSWTTLATQNGNTSAFSNTVVVPYLR